MFDTKYKKIKEFLEMNSAHKLSEICVVGDRKFNEQLATKGDFVPVEDVFLAKELYIIDSSFCWTEAREPASLFRLLGGKPVYLNWDPISSRFVVDAGSSVRTSDGKHHRCDNNFESPRKQDKLRTVSRAQERNAWRNC